jgi:hypothetical protein
LEGAGSEQLSEDARARITHLMKTSLPGLIDQSFLEMKQGVGRTAIDASNNDAGVAAFRNEMLDCVEAVAGKGD